MALSWLPADGPSARPSHPRTQSMCSKRSQAIWPLARIAAIPSNIDSLAFSPDGRYLAAGVVNSLCVYDRDRQWSEVFRDTDYSDRINVTFAADGRLATTNYDGKVRLYDRAFRLAVSPRKVTGGQQPARSAL